MNTLKSVALDTLEFNPFTKIGKEWMLITSGSEAKANTMTASWGGLGVMWGKNTAFIVVRQSRYTKEFIDNGGTFSLSFLPEEHRKALSYLGTVSGRTENKIEQSGLSLAFQDGIPYIAEGSMILLCKKLSATPLTADQFISGEIEEKWYKDGDLHTLYIGEILDVLA